MGKGSKKEKTANEDGPLGEQPASTGLGAVAGGLATGAVVGSVAGPLGAIAGAAAGAIAGGMVGRALGEAYDPVVEDAHWKETYSKETYYQTGLTYDDYGPAYRVGYQGRAEHLGRKFEDVQGRLEADYQRIKGPSKLAWEKAKHASRAAWDRVERAIPGDLDHDDK